MSNKIVVLDYNTRNSHAFTVIKIIEQIKTPYSVSVHGDLLLWRTVWEGEGDSGKTPKKTLFQPGDEGHHQS